MKLLPKIAFCLFPVLLGFQSILAGQSLSYLALGDSYTIGEKVSPSERWPVLLADTLRSMGYPVAEPEILAVTGWTTGDLKKGIENSDLKESYGLVSLLIGVNNQYRGYDIERFRNDFTFLLEKSIELAGNHPGNVLVLSIPDYGVTPFAENRDPSRISAEIERYNEIKEIISRKKGVMYVDITPISRKAEKHPELLAGDRLHPSGIMYQRWVARIIPVLVPKLKIRKRKQ